MAEAKTEKILKLKNRSKAVIVAGAIRINPDDVVELPESKVSEAMKRLFGGALEILEEKGGEAK